MQTAHNGRLPKGLTKSIENSKRHVGGASLASLAPAPANLSACPPLLVLLYLLMCVCVRAVCLRRTKVQGLPSFSKLAETMRLRLAPTAIPSHLAAIPVQLPVSGLLPCMLVRQPVVIRGESAVNLNGAVFPHKTTHKVQLSAPGWEVSRSNSGTQAILC